MRIDGPRIPETLIQELKRNQAGPFGHIGQSLLSRVAPWTEILGPGWPEQAGT